MTEEIQRRLGIAVKAIRHLCRLDTQAWTSRDRMFGAEEEWPDRILSKMIGEHMIDTGVRRIDGVPLYRVSRANRGKALALFTSLIEDPSFLEKLVDPARVTLSPPPMAPAARRTVLPPPPPPEDVATHRPNPALMPASRVMIEVSFKLYEQIQKRATSRGVTVKAYLLELLAADGVHQD